MASVGARTTIWYDVTMPARRCGLRHLLSRKAAPDQACEIREFLGRQDSAVRRAVRTGERLAGDVDASTMGGRCAALRAR
jgi:hypothetical protein